jgi:hypothetical protein
MLIKIASYVLSIAFLVQIATPMGVKERSSQTIREESCGCGKGKEKGK